MRLKPLHEEAYEYLKDIITHGEMIQGKFYSERKMADDIGVSRTPFKQALIRLSEERYIDIVPSKGFRLHVLTQQEIIDIFQYRSAIEGFCAFFLHSRRKEKEASIVIRAIENDLKQMEEAVFDNAPYPDIFKHDYNFHMRIVGFSKNDEFVRQLEAYKHHLFSIAKINNGLEGRASEVVREHREIYTQIISDEDRGVDTFLSVIRHLSNARDCAIMKSYDVYSISQNGLH